jgi:lipid-A-disaccharide synthase
VPRSLIYDDPGTATTVDEKSALHTSDEHNQKKDNPLIFISAAEPSGDLHGAALIEATLTRCPKARFVGVAGPKMVAAGCDRIFDMTPHSAMLLGALKVVGRGISMLNTSDRHLRRYPFDGAVVIDSPTLHLPLAARAQAMGIPVMYYIAPQIWAWGPHRIHKLRNRIDRAAVILPFEEKFFRDQGVNATYVGHPLAERWANRAIDQQLVSSIRSRGTPVVALLPGSRKHVVKEVLRGQLEVAGAIASAVEGVTFGVSVANSQVAPIIDEELTGSSVPVQRYTDSLAELIQAADLVLVASGTTALEVAFHGRPMIVMYNASRLFYQLFARWMIRTPHLSLPNILAGREIVPEFMPYYTSTAPIAERAIALLNSEAARQEMAAQLTEIVKPLRSGDGSGSGLGASERTAEMLLDMVGER